MVRLFNRHVPYAVLLLGLADLALLLASAEIGWVVRALSTRWPQLVSLAAALEVALVAVAGAVPREAIDNLAAHAVACRAGEVVLAIEERRNALPLKDLLRVRTAGVPVSEVSTFVERQTGRIDLSSISHSWLIFSDGFAAGRIVSGGVKRAFDIVASLALLIMTLPVVPITAVLIRLESPGPAFYRQRRVGLYNEGFDILKLRSMRQDAEVAGQVIWAAERDPRVTRIGRFIRKVRIDELAQALTILKGEMSFVGPRPERPQYVTELEQHLPFYAERRKVKPGLLLILLQTLRVLLWPSGAR